MTSEEVELSFELLGRTIKLRRALAGQLMILQRMAARITAAEEVKPGDPETWKLATRLNIDTLTVIESLIVEPEDVAWVEQQMLAGKVDVGDLRPVLSGGKVPAEVPADDAAPKIPIKAVKPRKAFRKAAAKKA